jgi:hypothetical protein
MPGGRDVGKIIRSPVIECTCELNIQRFMTVSQFKLRLEYRIEHIKVTNIEAWNVYFELLAWEIGGFSIFHYHHRFIHFVETY